VKVLSVIKALQEFPHDLEVDFFHRGIYLELDMIQHHQDCIIKETNSAREDGTHVDVEEVALMPERCRMVFNS